MTSQFSESEQPILSGENKQAAKAAYLGYAALANLTPKGQKEGLDAIEAATLEQSEKLRLGFVTVARTLMEINGYEQDEIDERLGEAIPVEENAAAIYAETLTDSLPSLVLRYIADVAGPVDDIQLRAEHVQIIKEVLLSFTPPARRAPRAGDIAQYIPDFLDLKLNGIQNDAIGKRYGIPGSRIKGAFFRFTEGITAVGTKEEIGKALRERLAAEGMLEKPIVPESIESIPTAVLYKTTPNVKRPVIKRKIAPKLPRLRDAVEVPQHLIPTDLLPDETMAERRVRLQAEAAAKGTDTNA